jgi:hypothetical protein
MPLMTGQHLLPHGVQIRSMSQHVVRGGHVLQGGGGGASHGAWQGAAQGPVINVRALTDVALNAIATKAKAVNVFFIFISYLLKTFFFALLFFLLLIQKLNKKS